MPPPMTTPSFEISNDLMRRIPAACEVAHKLLGSLSSTLCVRREAVRHRVGSPCRSWSGDRTLFNRRQRRPVRCSCCQVAMCLSAQAFHWFQNFLSVFIDPVELIAEITKPDEAMLQRLVWI